MLTHAGRTPGNILLPVPRFAGHGGPEAASRSQRMRPLQDAVWVIAGILLGTLAYFAVVYPLVLFATVLDAASFGTTVIFAMLVASLWDGRDGRRGGMPGAHRR